METDESDNMDETEGQGEVPANPGAAPANPGENPGDAMDGGQTAGGQNPIPVDEGDGPDQAMSRKAEAESGDEAEDDPAPEPQPPTFAQIMLEKIEGILQGRPDNDIASYSIGGRAINRMSMAELRVERDQYRKERRAEIDAELVKSGQRSHKKMVTMFR